jgi:site-specific recombinase XerD
MEFSCPEVEKFFKHIKSIRQVKTAQIYSAAAERFEEFLEHEEIDLASAEGDLFDQYVTFLAEREFSPSTIRLYSIGARRYVDYLRKSGTIKRTFEKAELPKSERKPIVSLSEEDLLRFLECVDETVLDPCKTIVKLLPYCGLRVSEIVSLKLSNIKSDGKSNLSLSFFGKGNKHRSVPLEKNGKKFLMEYLRNVRVDCVDRVYLFPESERSRDKHISPRSVQSAVANVREHAKLGEETTPHTLRKTYATMLIDKGVPLSTVSNLLGHAALDVTLQHYIDVKDKNRVDAVNLL